MEEYTFKGDEGESIDPTKARRFRDNYEKSMAENDVKGHFFGNEKIQALLDTHDAVGIRIYYGINDKGEKELILYSVRSDGSDINPQSIILDVSKKCPPYCG